ncbi:MAG: sigma-70 family RNA polymerase sigma factor [Candidatus Omnitrophota bacterium]|nr:sigma-70 family RNA polymerase sigma factor [Candidatus Omnitrophota bacterium]MBU1929725.1 sigma-70 family RNA polymerase sigma factor [Candidatus Omnitrophota bacterium]MBU2035123.1 sigma-70 family RNA polymerase sigma factor [Candidatus Omnitrophota bacterium]MBU2221982.1 sigma-70 family RNA polymerase sigma factor [Candidatus Omnitrophota bacterium]MBU2257778.1 sigma-70 family RNA polymerase sigma factor [Candidatus Omnitrophota bacterium]
MEFNDLSAKLSSKLKAIAYRLNHQFTFFNEEDLYQEALIRLWEDSRTGRLDDKTDSYILQGCYFHLKNYIRKNRVKTKLVSIEENVGQGENSFEDLFLKDEKSPDLRDRLNDLFLAETILNNGFTLREKQVLRGYAEGLTTRQIGEKLGVSHVSVVKMTDRIRKKSRRYID